MSEQLRKAAQQALTCLDGVARGDYDGNSAVVCTVLRTALAIPEPEPVAWMKRLYVPGDRWDAYDFSANRYGEFQTPLYAVLPNRAPLTDAEIDAACGSCDDSDLARGFRREFIRHFRSIYERLPSPPKRKPLTDELLRAEFAKLYKSDATILNIAENNRDYTVKSIGARHHWAAFKAGARAIEKAHEII